jgi:hypothetical protein
MLSGGRVATVKPDWLAEGSPSSSAPAVLRINVTERYSLLEWSKRLGCTPKELRAAAALVGNVAADIEAQFRPVRDREKEQAALRGAFFERVDAGD